MLEKENIQQRGFKNVSEGRKITGFQLPFRSTYYRGVWLSQLSAVTITVDGEKFQGDQVTWRIGGKTYAQSDLIKYPEVQWPITETAIFYVKKPGGLSLGIHDVEVAYGYTSSYTSYPENGWTRDSVYKRRMSLAR